MNKVDAAYMKVRDGEVARTLEIRSDLLVDVDIDGFIIGVERIGDVVTVDDLVAVVKSMVAKGYRGDSGIFRRGDRPVSEPWSPKITERAWVFPIEAKVDALLPDGTHRYWSTHCRHDRHEACSATEIRGVWRGNFARFDRAPAQCKTCGAPCICPCHSTPELADRHE